MVWCFWLIKATNSNGIFQKRHEREENHSAERAGGAAGRRHKNSPFQTKEVIPVSVQEVIVRFWSQTSGACTPHSVQRRLQVATPPKQDSRQVIEEKRGIEKVHFQQKKGRGTELNQQPSDGNTVALISHLSQSSIFFFVGN